jgi:tellurium resistance protein TerZ
MTSLRKEDGPVTINAQRVSVVGSWESSTGGAGGLRGKLKQFRGVNLDNLGIIMQGTRPVNYAGLDNLTPEDGITHSGDTRGKRPETLEVDLDKVPQEITAVLLAMVAHQPGNSFRDARNVRVTVKADEEYVIRPSIVGRSNFVGVAKLYRSGAGWALAVVDQDRTYPQGDRDALVGAATGM